MYYAATIITMSGVYDKSLAVWMASATAILNFLITIPAIYLVEKIGRRPLTLLSLAGVIMSLSFLAIAFQVIEKDSPMVSHKSVDYGINSRTEFTDLVNYCNGFTDCSSCVDDPRCGYCFEDTDGGHGSCLAGDESVELGRSLFDTCSNGTIAEEKKVWALDWCPSRFSWLTLFGLCLYLIFFAPGMG